MTRLILFLITCLMPCLSIAQSMLEQLLMEQQQAESMRDKYSSLIKLGNYYSNAQAYQKANNYFELALQYGKSSDQKELFKTIGQHYVKLHKFSKAIEWYKILEQNQPTSKEQIWLFNELSQCNTALGYFDESEKYNQQLIQLYTQVKDSANLALTQNTLGLLAQYQGRYQMALKHFDAALALSQDMQQQYQIRINKGYTFMKDHNYSQAKRIFEEIYQLSEYEESKMQALHYMAETLHGQGKSSQALEHALQANTLLKALFYPKLQIENTKLLADIYSSLKETTNAQLYTAEYQRLQAELIQAEQIQKDEYTQLQLELEQQEADTKAKLIQIRQQEAAAREAQLQKDKQEAELHQKQQELSLLKKEQELKNSQLKQQQLEQMQIEQLLKLAEREAFALKKESEFQAQKEEAERQRLLAEKAELLQLNQEKALIAAEKEKEAQAQQLSQTKLIRKYGFGIFGLTILIFALLGYGFLSTRKAKRIIQKKGEELQVKNEEMLTQNEELMQAQEELQTQRDYVKAQNQILEITSSTINASIAYAQNIQAAILPDTKALNHFFADNFLIYYPKDIVSGDFYWWEVVDDKLMLAIVDCTGHGVPGAFMSMIGYSLLNEIVVMNRRHDPALVLELIHRGIFKALKQDKSKNQDGMDMMMLVIDPTTPESDHVNIQFAGAKLNLLYMNETTENKLIELKGVRRSIGGSFPIKKQFKTEHLQFPKGTHLYLTTDGFIDQNNAKREKFGKVRLRNLLEEIGNLDTQDQLAHIKQVFKKHKEGQGQRDDVTFLGIRL